MEILWWIWAAVIIDWIIGDPKWITHPVVFIGKWIRIMEKRLRRSKISLKIGGFLLMLSTLTVTGVSIHFIEVLSLQIHPIVHKVIALYLMSAALAARCLRDEVMKVVRVLLNGDLIQSRIALSWLVGRDTADLSESEVLRATVETTAENTVDGVLAPLFYLMIGFLIGYPLQTVYLYKAINTLDSMVGYMNEKYRLIGYFSAKLDDLANYLPARIGSVMMLLAGSLFHLDVKSGWKIFLRDRKNHKSPNCGYPESVAAGLLGVQLGGSNRYFGELVSKPTIGDCVHNLNYSHVEQSTYLIFGSEIIMVLIFSFSYLLIQFALT